MRKLEELLAANKNYHHGNLAHDIVQTSLVLIEQLGIDNLSLRHAASICGVSATAVYRHFASKELLLLACATEGYGRLAREMKAKPSSHAGQQLNELGFGYLSFAYKHKNLFTFMFTADLSQASVEQNEIFMESYQHLRNVIAKGVEQKIFRGSVDTLTVKAWALVHGLATLVIANRIPVRNFSEFIELAQAMFAGNLE